MRQNGLNWQCCLAGSSKTAPRRLIFSAAMGAKPSLYMKFIPRQCALCHVWRLLNLVFFFYLNTLKAIPCNVVLTTIKFFLFSLDQNEAAEDGDVSDNVSTVADDFVANLPTKTICIDAEDKENNQGRRPQSFSETTSVKSCSVVNNNINNSSNSNGKRPRLNRAHSCGSLFSLKERALLRQKLSSHVTAAFWDILQSSTNAVTGSSVTSSGHLEAGHTCNGVGHSAMEVNHKKQQQDLTLALKTNPLAVFQLQSTSRCCNLC